MPNKPPGDCHMLHISDETWTKAMEVLASKRHATAKLAFESLTRQRKALMARLERESNAKTQRERETYALCHPHMEALDSLLSAAEAEYYEARDERDSAQTIINTWQTLRADARAVERMR